MTNALHHNSTKKARLWRSPAVRTSVQLGWTTWRKATLTLLAEPTEVATPNDNGRTQQSNQTHYATTCYASAKPERFERSATNTGTPCALKRITSFKHTATLEPPPKVAPATKSHTTGAWIATGTGIAFATVGAVLALSASSTQDDLNDLLATRTPSGQPPVFDGVTRTRYNDLITTGERYQTLSWVSFGVAGAAGIAATYLFLTSDGSTQERSPATAGKALITPTIGRNFASVSATLRF